MISESSYWKDELLETSVKLEAWQEADSLSEKDFFEIEREVFFAAYSIRKLIEAHKLSDNVVADHLNGATYLPTGKPITLLNWHKLEELYCLDERQETSLSLRFFCNQLIHSYIFFLLLDETGGLYGIYFSSDRKRSEALFEVSIEELRRILELIGNDYPNQMSFVFNPSKQDYDTQVSTHIDLEQPPLLASEE